MDPAHRAFLAIFFAVLLKSILAVQWGRFKARQEAKPTPMKLRNGVYVPWGPVQRIERIGAIGARVGFVYIGLCLALLAYMKIMGLPRLF